MQGSWEEPGTMKLDDNDLIDGQEAARLLHASIYTVRDYKKFRLIKIAGKDGNKDLYSRRDVMRLRLITDQKQIEGHNLSQISAEI
jgi:DNA-binding transcriptional MerR regulator